MKHKLTTFVLTFFFLTTSLAFAQVDKATGTVTNDATMARLRVAHFVFGGPDIDLLVNDEIPVNKDVVQADLFPGYVGSYLYLEPGTYSVAVIPTGKGVDEALIGPLDIPLEAGHRYTLAMMGQMEDEGLTPLVIDETVELNKVRTSPTQQLLTVANNIAGTQNLDFDAFRSGPLDVPYGGFRTSVQNGEDFLGEPFAITVDGDPEAFIEEPHPDSPGNVGAAPGISRLAGFMGHYTHGGDGIDGGEGGGYSDLDIVTFLQNFSGAGYMAGFHEVKFDTFLAALETTGLTEMLKTGGPYMVWVPTDEAFAALPEGELDALMADPEALANLLRYHIVEGYYPRGGLTGEEGHPKLLTNLLGMELELVPNPLKINGISVGDIDSLFVVNGSRVGPITAVLMPPEQAATQQSPEPSAADGALAQAFSCGPHFATYSISGPGNLSNHVRCVKFINRMSFAWYGEGRWGEDTYRHLGYARSPLELVGDPASITLTGFAADFSGNGETISDFYDGTIVIRISNTSDWDGVHPPSEIVLGGTWDETWTLQSEVSGYSALEPVLHCGSYLQEYSVHTPTNNDDSADSDDPRTNVQGNTAGEASISGVRCLLNVDGKQPAAWYGEGASDGAMSYGHIGTASFEDSATHWGASGICSSRFNVCEHVPFGELDLRQERDGAVIRVTGAWNGRWER